MVCLPTPKILSDLGNGHRQHLDGQTTSRPNKITGITGIKEVSRNAGENFDQHFAWRG
jgi:hypothetical protein